MTIGTPPGAYLANIIITRRQYGDMPRAPLRVMIDRGREMVHAATPTAHI